MTESPFDLVDMAAAQIIYQRHRQTSCSALTKNGIYFSLEVCHKINAARLSTTVEQAALDIQQKTHGDTREESTKHRHESREENRKNAPLLPPQHFLEIIDILGISRKKLVNSNTQ